MKAKIVTGLTGTATEGEHFEPHGTLQHVAHLPRPGVICQLKLGANGLQYCRGGVATHVIQLKELIALFEKLEPKFGEAPNGNTRPREVDELGAPAGAGATIASGPRPAAPGPIKPISQKPEGGKMEGAATKGAAAKGDTANTI
jgi:hypothetical protein